jgi:hypothetical protein
MQWGQINFIWKNNMSIDNILLPRHE